MKPYPSIVATLAASLAVAAASTALAQAPARDQTQTQTQTQQRIYGSQLMTAQERNEYQQRMRELKTQEEREQFRKEHHARMQERAKERGVTLPAEPPARGMGAGPRDSSRPGAGAGRR